MKNVVKIALLSTAAMVGAAQADINTALLSDIKTQINTTFTTVGGSNLTAGGTNTALNNIIAKVDAHYGAESVTSGQLLFDLTTFQYTYADPEFVNEDTGSVVLTDEIAALTKAINLELIGIEGGLNTVTAENSANLLGTLATNNSLISTKAAALDSAVTAVNDYIGGATGETGFDKSVLDAKVLDVKAAVDPVSLALGAVNTLSTDSANFGTTFVSTGIQDSIYSGTQVDNAAASTDSYTDSVDHFIN